VIQRVHGININISPIISFVSCSILIQIFHTLCFLRVLLKRISRSLNIVIVVDNRVRSRQIWITARRVIFIAQAAPMPLN